jgi:CheY-like chemotaxis protein
VVEALNTDPATSRIPVVVVTASTVTAEERFRLHDSVATIMAKGGFDGEQFLSEVRRAMAGRPAAV